jgi:membrane-bound lytic murein transglycosylase A
VLLAALALAACGHPKPPPSAPATLGLRKVAFASIAGWSQDDASAALAAFRITCDQLRTMSPQAPLGGTGEAARLGGHVADWLASCRAADAASNPRGFFETWFQPYAVGNATTDQWRGLFTGYYEPEYQGSRTRAPGFAAPLRRLPADLVRVDLGAFLPDLQGRSVVGRVQDGTLIPYWDRAQIEAGALGAQHLEMLWLRSPVDAFVLEIEGSGRVGLADGTVVRVSYAGQNGRPYVPIGRDLIRQGAISRAQMSMQAIEAWLAAHPDQAGAVMDRNPSYVFFRFVDGVPPEQGPPGALGAPLTPGRSIAIDRHFLPLGAPVFVATSDPLTGAPMRRLMQAQDVGGAIRGPVRADYFWGWGADAQAHASPMQAVGREFVLLPKVTR